MKKLKESILNEATNKRSRVSSAHAEPQGNNAKTDAINASTIATISATGAITSSSDNYIYYLAMLPVKK